MFQPIEDTEARKRHEADAKAHSLMKSALAAPAAGSGSGVADIRDWFGKRTAAANSQPPRDPTPRSPFRQAVPMAKTDTNAVGKLHRDRGDDLPTAARLGDLLIKTIAENRPNRATSPAEALAIEQAKDAARERKPRKHA